MKQCPNCGCLNKPDNEVCSMCHEYLDKDQMYVEEEKVTGVEEKNSKVGKFFNKTFIDNANIIEDDKNNFKDQYVPPKKDNSTTKAAILTIVVVILIIGGVALGIYMGWFNPKNTDEEILKGVVKQANNYEQVILNYLKKYDYKTNTDGKSTYHAKNQEYPFFEFNMSEECKYEDSTYSDTFCEQLLKDINNNYCRATACDIPSFYTIKINYKEENTTDSEGNQIIKKVHKLDDYTTFTYEDVECTKLNNQYKCEYKK